ncbi:MAG: Kelch motif-containing protein [Chloroflexi bacterium]|nr:MAG: Kelch motif-containing protein [Chloroflexota bacterium]
MPDGAVLIAGGSGDFNTGAAIVSIEVYDPATGDWTEISPLLVDRVNHTASLLTDGTVLFFGGDLATGGTVERYDVSAAVAVAQSVDVADPIEGARINHSATTLADGRVLIAGGAGLSAAELYDLSGTASGPVEEPLEPVSLFDALAPDTTLLVSEVPAGLSLLTFSGIPTALLAESALATAQGNSGPDIDDGELLIEADGIVETSVLTSAIAAAFVGAEGRILNVITKANTDGSFQSYRPNVPDVANTLKQLDAPAVVWAGTEQDAIFIQGYVHAQDRLFHFDSDRGGFLPLVNLGPAITPSDFLAVNPAVQVIWAWDNPNHSWIFFNPALPPGLQGIRTIPFLAPFIAFAQGPATITFGAGDGLPGCDLVLDDAARDTLRGGGGRDILLGAFDDAGPGGQAALQPAGNIAFGLDFTLDDIDTSLDILNSLTLAQAQTDLLLALACVDLYRTPPFGPTISTPPCQ